MAEDMIKRLVSEQRKRVVGSIMGAAEQSAWWNKISPVEQRAFRQKVLDSIGVFYDFILDIIKVGADGVVNEEAVQMIAQVHASAQRIERALANGR